MISSHLGPRVSALLDGHLSPAEEERCWAHVHECHACRDLVEREGWVKTRLASLSFGPSEAPDRLKDSLLGRGSALMPAPFPTAPVRAGTLDGGSRLRARGLVAIGGGAAGACVVGVLALGMAGTPRVDPRPPVTNLSGPTAPVTVEVVKRTPRRRPAEGRDRARRPALTPQVVTVREKMAR